MSLVLRPLTLLDALIVGILAISTAGASEHRSYSVKDHVVPFACGGPDSVANLQWQTTAAARDKDRWERNGCRR
jgi:hypothetical protein